MTQVDCKSYDDLPVGSVSLRTYLLRRNIERHLIDDLILHSLQQ